MSLSVNNVAARTLVKASGAPTPPAAPTAAPTANAPSDPNAMAKMGQFLKTVDPAGALQKAINAKGSDEVIAALTGGVSQLIVERTGVKDFDQKLHDDYSGTITAHVSDPTAQKVLLTLGNILGDKVASNLISAGIGALTGTMVNLLKDAKFRDLYKTDPKAFGLELAKRTGTDFGVALLAAFATAKTEQAVPWFIKLFKSWFGKN